VHLVTPLSQKLVLLRKPSQCLTHLCPSSTLFLQHSLRLNESIILWPNLPLIASTWATWFRHIGAHCCCCWLSCSQISLADYGCCTRPIRRGVRPITKRNHHIPSIHLLGPRRDDPWSVPFLLHSEALPFPSLGDERLQLRRVLSTGRSPIQKYYSDKKIEKSAGSFCGQKYSIDKSITNRLLAGFSALIFRNQNPAYTIKKRKGETLIYWRNSKFGTEWIHLLAELHCCTGFVQHGSFCATTVPPLLEGKCALLLWVLRSLLRCMHCTLSPARTIFGA
jgi:hypothetical protein